jgi:hypothetical protein
LLELTACLRLGLQRVNRGHGGSVVNTRTLLRGTAALIVLAATTPGLAVPVAIDTTNASNGITDLFSATFDGALSPCTAGSPPYCSFFNGWPSSAARNIVISPNPGGVINAVPLGFGVFPDPIAPPPASGSFLNLTLNGTNTQLTLAGGTIAFPSLVLTISGGTPSATNVSANGAGVVFSAAPQTAAVDGNGTAEFLVNLAPATAVDFSIFQIVAFPPVGSCAGPLCGLIPILTLDMVKYRLLIQFDPTFTYFTASFIGQTGNNSILSITMNSVAPEIAVTDSVPPAGDLQVPFGDVTELTSATQTVTVTNSGGANLLLGTVDLVDPQTTFAVTSDGCTGATVLPATSCTIELAFTPGSVGTFNGSLTIPSNDLDEPSVTVALSGNGVSGQVPSISVTDSVPPATDQLIPFGSAAIGAQLDQTVTVSNAGNADLVLGTVAVADGLIPPFSIINDNCSGQTLQPTFTCTIGVRFEPTAVNNFNESFDIPSNDPTDPTVTVLVTGAGTLAAPEISVTNDTSTATDPHPLLVSFGNVTEATVRDRTITVTNLGGADLLVGAIAGTDPLAEPFSLVTDNCSNQTIGPAGSCTFVARYAPSDTTDSSDSLDIPSNDADEASVSVSLTGTGITQGEGGLGTPSPSGASSGFMAVDPATLLLLSAAGVWGWRRRRAQ